MGYDSRKHAERKPTANTWLVGYAAATGRPFWNEHRQRRELFVRGCFAHAHDRDVFLSVNHHGSRGGVMNRQYSLASRGARTLVLSEDIHGLFFAAMIARTAAVQYDEAAPINVVDAIEGGRCLGVSIFFKRGTRYAHPTDVLTWATVEVEEISLIFPPSLPPTCPGTWAAIDSPRTRARVQACQNAEALCQ